MDIQTDIDMAAYNAAYLNMVALKFGGDATVNEIRVMNCVFRSHMAEKNIGVARISREMEIPKSTVSRAVLNLRAAGWIKEELSNSDGRRRFLRLTPKLLNRFAEDKELLQRYWPRAA